MATPDTHPNAFRIDPDPPGPFDVITVPGGQRVRLVAELACKCPLDGSVDTAAVDVAYITNTLSAELKSFAEWLGTFRETSISHEHLTQQLADELFDGLGIPAALIVTTTWDVNHGVGCEVTVERSPRDPDENRRVRVPRP